MHLIMQRRLSVFISCLMRTLVRAACALLMLLLPAAAHAACQTSNGSAKFTDSGSYTVQANGVGQISTSAGFSCSGSVIAVVSTNYARATVTSARGFALVGPTGDRIPYIASADQASAYTFNQYGTIDYMDPTIISLLTILSGNTLSPKIYLTINGNANVAAGTYTDTLTVQWSWNICHGLGVGNLCVIGETGTGTSTIPVTIIVGNDCQITAPPVAFGTAAVVSQFAPITQSVLVDCTKGTNYLIGFSSGSASIARPWRTMKDGSGRILQYNIYRPDGVTVWDESNPLASGTPGTGFTNPTKPFAYQASINPDQAAPVAGTYADNVSVVVTF